MSALLMLVMAVAIAPARVVASEPLGIERAQWLLTRVGFAPAADDIAAFANLDQRAAVEQVLAQSGTHRATPPPDWSNDRIIPPRDLRAMTDEERRAERRAEVRRSLQLRAWWLTEMAATRQPLTERMTLFWHNHFVSAQPKVRYAQLMFRQNELLRANALGNFGTLLHAIAKDPAMLVYLDGATSRKSAPNENFAREVMELFTLGEGHYSESDVKDAARAFTGWSLDSETLQFTERRMWHDESEKSVLGQHGNFNGDEVLDILLAQPATAESIVSKLWREFVSPVPDPGRVTAIAARFRAANYKVEVALRELFNQPELIERNEDNALVKSPVELAIGLIRQSGGAIEDGNSLALAVAAMGQNLMAAPNVRGWPGGQAWITTQTLLARMQFVERALANSAPSSAAASVSATAADAAMTGEGDGMRARVSPGAVAASNPLAQTGGNGESESAVDGAAALRRVAARPAVRIDALTWLKPFAISPERIAGTTQRQALERAVLALPAVNGARSESLGLDALRALLRDPVYQLK